MTPVLCSAVYLRNIPGQVFIYLSAPRASFVYLHALTVYSAYYLFRSISSFKPISPVPLICFRRHVSLAKMFNKNHRTAQAELNKDVFWERTMYIVVLGGRKVIFSIRGAIYSELRLPRDNMNLPRIVCSVR